MEINSKFRKAVFIVTYSIQKNKIYYLVLKRKLHWKGWEFPKGGIDFPESKKSAVKRELKEETSLVSIKIKKFNFSGKYKYKKIYPDRRKFIGQDYSLYSVKVKKEKVKIDEREHSDYKWLDFKQALKKLTFPNQKESLKIINNFLKNEKN